MYSTAIYAEASLLHAEGNFSIRHESGQRGSSGLDSERSLVHAVFSDLQAIHGSEVESVAQIVPPSNP